MVMIKASLTILFSIVIWFSGCEFCGASPLKNIPKGWINLPEEGYESDPGSYFDLISGAQVKYDVGFAFAIGYWTEWLSPFYKINRGPITFGLTKEGCWVITLLLPIQDIKDGIAANFSACPANSRQQNRIKHFLMASRLVRIDSDDNKSDFETRWRQINSEQMSKIYAGMNYFDVIKVAGHPLYGAITSQGFKISYWPHVPGERCRHCYYFSVYFDSKAEVIETKREDEWWTQQ